MLPWSDRGIYFGKVLDVARAVTDNGHIRQNAATLKELSTMSDFTISELKLFVLGNITIEQARAYGDLRKRSTWEAAYNDCVRLFLDPVQLEEPVADPVTETVQETAQPVSLTETAIATVIEVTDQVYSFAEVAVPVVKQAWTKAEPILFQGLFFTVVLAIFFYWFTASAVQKFYLAIEYTFLQLVQDTSPVNVLVHDGWSVNTEETLLLAPCEAS